MYSTSWTEPALRLSRHLPGPSSRVIIEYQQLPHRAGPLVRTSTSIELAWCRLDDGVAVFNFPVGQSHSPVSIPLVDLSAFYCEFSTWVLRINGSFDLRTSAPKYISLGPLDMSIGADRRSLLDVHRVDPFHISVTFPVCGCETVGKIDREHGLRDSQPWLWSIKPRRFGEYVAAGRDASEEGAIAAVRWSHESCHWLIDLVGDGTDRWSGACHELAVLLVSQPGPSMPTDKIYSFTHDKFGYLGSTHVSQLSRHFLRKTAEWRGSGLPNSIEILSPMYRSVVGMLPVMSVG